MLEMYKKIMSLLLVVTFTVSLAACGRSNEQASQNNEDNTGQDQKVISTSVPSSNRQLEMAVINFQEEHSEYRIDLQTYPSSDYETYVKNLNTQILSGMDLILYPLPGCLLRTISIGIYWLI